MPVEPRRTVQRALATAGVRVVRSESLTELQRRARHAERRLAVLGLMSSRPVEVALRMLDASRAQLQQDIFAWSRRDFRTGGFFVEFGACDGVQLSNTQMLEAEHGWTGILAEPARRWHDALAGNRPSAHIDRGCVWSRTGDELMFVEPEIAELSTVETFAEGDRHSTARRRGARYSVPTISLDDLLDKYDAPEHIDYLSLDTEGSEHEILAAHDFGSRAIHVITCEHNYSPSRELVHRLLVENGYERHRTDLSLWDDWYVLGR
jgi:FkbM family methyltransferase